ncbi:MAG TPA: PHP domain-containing protein [Capillimicrobium sp.]|nr:PHP domain-containing protein [Capillimicrobium sp.]
MAAPLAIAHVTPYAWESGHEVNRAVARMADELAGRGHRVLIVAPSSDLASVRETEAALRAARDRPDGLLPSDGRPRLLSVGEALPAGTARRAALPIDVSRSIEALQLAARLDICHVHEPFAPSVASAALRHSRALNVGTFHLPAERIVSTQVARKLVDRIFGRLDARTASFAATAALMERWFPADYRVVTPGADLAPRGDRPAGSPLRIAFLDDLERPALRVFLRGLRQLPLDVPWEVVVLSARGPSSSTPLRTALRDRVRFASPAELGEQALLAGADVLVAASAGAAPAPGLLLRARAAGVIPVASRLPVYEEAVDEGDAGLLFEPGDVETLGAQLARLLADDALRDRLRAARAPRDWASVADELEGVYGELVGRRHDGRGRRDVARRLAGRRMIDVDLHMHTDHSGDCATPVEVLLATAREQGLGAIAVTDHNEISGALEAQAKAAEFGVKVIVGEEVKTATQGEVIGLFLKEKIPRGMTLQETVAEIKRQGGLVYVPHPFDRMHAVPDYEHLLAIVDDVDAIEVYNPRVAIGAFNEEAERFAAKYRIVAGAGSDSHVAQGLGSVRIRMRDFDGPEEFLESLREADIVTKPTSLLYVQALKFLETKATPPAARKARRERRVRRATRKS